jgi:hypothetical protein
MIDVTCWTFYLYIYLYMFAYITVSTVLYSEYIVVQREIQASDLSLCYVQTFWGLPIHVFKLTG